eukprot:09160_1
MMCQLAGIIPTGRLLLSRGGQGRAFSHRPQLQSQTRALKELPGCERIQVKNRFGGRAHTEQSWCERAMSPGTPGARIEWSRHTCTDAATVLSPRRLCRCGTQTHLRFQTEHSLVRCTSWWIASAISTVRGAILGSQLLLPWFRLTLSMSMCTFHSPS